MQSIKGKVALVTGASKGIGKAIARMLAKQGVNLAVNSSSLDNLKLLQKEIELAQENKAIMMLKTVENIEATQKAETTHITEAAQMNEAMLSIEATQKTKTAHIIEAQTNEVTYNIEAIQITKTAHIIEAAQMNEATQKETESANVEVLLCPADLADHTAPAEIIKRIIDKFGRLDILINNAGIAVSKSIEESTVNDWDLQMAVNARAPFLLCREAIPYLRKSESPVIINISSVVGKRGYVNQSAYTASKHALMGMTKVLAQEVFDDNIRVHIISPGGVATDMVSKMRPDLDISVMPKPEDIADIVEFILTHRGNAVIDDINIRRAGNCPWK